MEKTKEEVLSKYLGKESVGKMKKADAVSKSTHKRIDNMENSSKPQVERKFIGKIKEIDGQYGKFQSIVLDNPKSDSEYYKGHLEWVDQNGDRFLIKQLSVRGVGEHSKKYGFTNSIAFEPENEYQAEKL